MVTIHDEGRPWTRQDNQGGSLSPRQAAFLWALPPRTVQRWASAGDIPDCYARGKRLLIRRTRASFEWLQKKKLNRYVRGRKKAMRDPKSPFNQPAYLNLRFVYALAETYGSFDKWKTPSALSDDEKVIYKKNPGLFGLIAVAATILQENKRFSIQAVADRIKNTKNIGGGEPIRRFKVSRSSIYRLFHPSASSELKKRAALLLSLEDPRKTEQPARARFTRHRNDDEWISGND
jgi:hypothetical protein